jgi:hypothetical protein
VYPYYSKVENIGFNEEGTHCHGINVYVSEMDLTLKKEFNFVTTTINIKTSKYFLIYFSKLYKLKYRVRLLRSSDGRKQIKEELIRKFIS